MRDIMLDIEALGKRATGVILQVGMVAFDIHTGEVGPSLEFNFDLADSLRSGFQVGGGTIKWWMRQPDTARQAVLSSPTQTIIDGLLMITKFCKQFTDPRLWSHATFDTSMLNYHFDKMGLPVPYRYKQQLDLRTMAFIAGEYDTFVKRPKKGIKHTAKFDCLAQVKQLCGMWLKLKDKIESK